MDEIEVLIKRYYNNLLNLKESEVDAYIKKLRANATFVTHMENGSIVGFLAFYTNNTNKKFSYATMLIVDPQYRKMGIANELLKYWVEHARARGFSSVKLEVNVNNPNSIRMCQKVGFKILKKSGEVYTLERLV